MEDDNRDSNQKKIDTENDLIDPESLSQVNHSQDQTIKKQSKLAIDVNDSENQEDLNQADDNQGLLRGNDEEEKYQKQSKSPNQSTNYKVNKSPQEIGTATPNEYKQTDEKSFNGDKKHLHSQFEQNQIEIEEEHKHELPINQPYAFNQKSNQIMIGKSQPVKALFENQYNNNNQSPQEQAQQKKNMGKFTEFLIAEKQRKFVRLPRVYGKRKPMNFKCPNCKTDKEQRTKLKYESTGNQWCACIVFCFFACYPLCCVPFCIKRCYNIKHLCPQCMYQVGESGI